MIPKNRSSLGRVGHIIRRRGHALVVRAMGHIDLDVGSIIPGVLVTSDEIGPFNFWPDDDSIPCLGSPLGSPLGPTSLAPGERRKVDDLWRPVTPLEALARQADD